MGFHSFLNKTATCNSYWDKEFHKNVHFIRQLSSDWPDQIKASFSSLAISSRVISQLMGESSRYLDLYLRCMEGARLRIFRIPLHVFFKMPKLLRMMPSEFQMEKISRFVPSVPTETMLIKSVNTPQKAYDSVEWEALQRAALEKKLYYTTFPLKTLLYAEEIILVHSREFQFAKLR